MIVTACWLVLLAALVAWEAICRHSGGRWPSAARLGGLLGTRVPGRLALVVVWGYVGWHLFARYTVPH